MSDATLFVAFFAGIASFLSPCVFPLMPGFIGYLAGTGAKKTQLFLASVFFVLGFSIIFAGLGVLLNTVLEAVAYDARLWLGRIGGIIIIFFGLFLLGVVKPKFLMMEKKIHVKKMKNMYL